MWALLKRREKKLAEFLWFISVTCILLFWSAYPIYVCSWKRNSLNFSLLNGVTTFPMRWKRIPQIWWLGEFFLCVCLFPGGHYWCVVVHMCIPMCLAWWKWSRKSYFSVKLQSCPTLFVSSWPLIELQGVALFKVWLVLLGIQRMTATSSKWHLILEKEKKISRVKLTQV